MNKRFFALLIVLSIVLALILATTAQSQEETSITITVVERATTDVVTDLGEEGDSVGDVLTFANEVYDADNAEMVGTDQGYCVRVIVGESWECTWTLTLEEGQLVVSGPFYDAADSAMAITGGTGDYQDARGQMNLHARNAEGTEFDFVYEISLR